MAAEKQENILGLYDRLKKGYPNAQQTEQFKSAFCEAFNTNESRAQLNPSFFLIKIKDGVRKYIAAKKKNVDNTQLAYALLQTTETQHKKKPLTAAEVVFIVLQAADLAEQDITWYRGSTHVETIRTDVLEWSEGKSAEENALKEALKSTKEKTKAEEQQEFVQAIEKLKREYADREEKEDGTRSLLGSVAYTVAGGHKGGKEKTTFDADIQYYPAKRGENRRPLPKSKPALALKQIVLKIRSLNLTPLEKSRYILVIENLYHFLKPHINEEGMLTLPHNDPFMSNFLTTQRDALASLLELVVRIEARERHTADAAGMGQGAKTTYNKEEFNKSIACIVLNFYKQPGKGFLFQPDSTKEDLYRGFWQLPPNESGLEPQAAQARRASLPTVLSPVKEGKAVEADSVGAEDGQNAQAQLLNSPMKRSASQPDVRSPKKSPAGQPEADAPQGAACRFLTPTRRLSYANAQPEPSLAAASSAAEPLADPEVVAPAGQLVNPVQATS